MLSPLFDTHEFFEEGWDMTAFHREAATLMDAELWANIDVDAQRLDIVPPAGAHSDDEIDWAVALAPEEHKERKLVHHDCMWAPAPAWSCEDSVIGALCNTFVPAEPFAASTGRSLLKREPAPSPPRPETPPSLDDDEPPQFLHAVDVAGTALRLLRDSAAVAADHSYTLAKPATKHRFDNLGVQTPSDSEEEIDVVSVGDKSAPALSSGRAESLPRVPSASERHHIQKTIQESAMSPRPAARKKLTAPAGVTPPRKRSRGSGRRGRRSPRSPTDTDSDGDVPDHERRAVHNDMERMRRIGLKNLFDELKNQIPATREKERAPKVVILREAASLCRRLQEEDLERDYLKRQQNKLLAKLKKLRSQLASRYRPY